MQGLLAVNPCKRPWAASQSAFRDHLPVRLHGVLEPQEPRARTGRTKGRRASDPAAGSRRGTTMKAGRPSRSRLPGLGEGRRMRSLVGRRATCLGAREPVPLELRPRQYQHVAVPGCRLEVQPANDEVAFVFPCRHPGEGFAGDAELADLGPEVGRCRRTPRITVPWIETVMMSLLCADRGETRHPGGIRARRRGLMEGGAAGSRTAARLSARKTWGLRVSWASVFFRRPAHL